MTLPFTHPACLWPAAGAAAAALLAGAWAALRPGTALRVVGQSPLRLGLGAALLVAGLGLGLAEPRWGEPELPRLTVHVVLDASRSMRVPDAGDRTRWQAALERLDGLWARPQPGLRFAVDLLTGDDIPLLPPGEDRILLRESLRAVTPGDLGSPGTSLGRGLAQAVAQVDPKTPAVLLLLSDGEETWETDDAALGRALAALREARLPLYAVVLGGQAPQPVPGGTGSEPPLSAAHPDLLKRLAEGSGGRVVAPQEDLAALLSALASGQLPLPAERSLQPTHPEWGAWLALLGLVVWLGAAGKPLARWRPILAGLLVLGGASARADLPVPAAIEAWVAQLALDQGRTAEARRWRPGGEDPAHRLLAAKIDLLASDPARALATLAPLTGLGAPRPLPGWRVPALLLAARAHAKAGHPAEARALLERLLMEQPGQREAIHDLQSLVPDPPPPPPPNPRKPPPPPRPSLGARQDEQEGLKQRLPPPGPPRGVKDI